MKKLLLSLSLAVAALCGSQAQTAVNLNGQWLFHYAATAAEADCLVADSFYDTKYKADSFEPTPVPSCWAVLGYEEPVYRGFKDDAASEGLYLRRFTLPTSFAGRRVLLHFGGVWASTEVWLNGQWIGRHDSGYTSFSFDVTGKTHPGKENVLAVRVRQVYPGYKTDTYDDWTLGGIYRDVTLETRPLRRWIDRVTCTTSFDADYRDAMLQLKMMIADDNKNTLPGNYRSPGKPYRLHVTLTDQQGQAVSDQTYDCASHTANYREQLKTIRLTAPHKWTAETPYLYRLRVELIEADTVAQTYEERIGVRQIETRGGVLTVNGQAVKLRGVNRHDEWPDVGRATTREHWLKDLTLMKQANINYIRAAHYQHARGFIELCDSIGMYVGGEVSLGGAGTMMFNPAYAPAVMQRVVETVRRDLNSASIIYWSVGNEDPLTELHLQGVKLVKALDPTRPVLLPWDADETLPAEVDILAPHYWTAHEYDSLAATSQRPIITTEYVHAYGEQRFGGLEDCWRALTSHPAGAGGAVWMWADQGIHTPTPKDTQKYKSIEKDSLYLRLDGAGWDGITDSYRRPTRDLYEVKSVYCPVYPAQPTVSCSSTVTIPMRNDYDFLSTDGLTIDYRVFVDGRQTAKGTSTVSIQPHATGHLTIPKTGIKRLRPGETAYVQLFINDATGHEIGRKSVELTATAAPAAVPTALAAVPAVSPAGPTAAPAASPAGTSLPLSLRETAEAITIAAGKHTYSFSRLTGMPADLRPVFWHALNEGDQIIRGRLNPDKIKTVVESMEARQTADAITVTSRLLQVANDSNQVSGTYTFTVSRDGRLTVSYAITPQVTLKYLPVVGMALKAQPRQWFGLGPDEAYPNKRSAPILGLYDARQMSGTRAARWLDTQDGRRITLGTDGYIDRDSRDAAEVNLLHHVLGRSEKGRLNDTRYQIVSSQTYRGTFTIENSK